MARTTGGFETIDGLEGIFCARKGTLRCTALRLTDGRFCLFSPVQGLSEAAAADLAADGVIAFLLAPNHYHNKAIAEYQAAFPEAQTIAPDAAVPRLGKITGLQFGGLDALAGLLPDTITILHPAGLKTGEIWLSVRSPGETVWIVVDAFCTMKENARQPVSDTPELLGTFPKFGIADAAAYRQWVEDRLASDNPSMIVPCHGSLIRSDNLPSKIRALMNAL